MTITVLTEQQVGPWHRCAAASYLMAMKFGGATFPLTVAELDAFAPNVGVPDLTVTDAEAQTRYGTHIPASPAPLSAYLGQPGLCIAIAGSNSRIPTRLHHWDPAYNGNHAVAVLTGPTLTWLDPEAPMKYAGDPVTAKEVLTWANPGAASFRVVKAGQFEVNTLPILPTDFIGDTADVSAGGTAYTEAGAVVAANYPGGNGLPALRLARQRPGKAALVPILIAGKVAFVGQDKVLAWHFTGQGPAPTPLAPGTYIVR